MPCKTKRKLVYLLALVWRYSVRPETAYNSDPHQMSRADEDILKPLARDSLINRAATTVHNYIIDRGMKDGDPLPSERQMASALLISRVTLRNALAILEGQGAIRRDRSGAAWVASTAGMRHAGDPEKLRSE